jgi:hypothetical protein
MSGSHTQTEKDGQRHLEETARRLNALPLHWDSKVEIWQEETSLSETTFAKILKRCGEFVPR